MKNLSRRMMIIGIIFVVLAISFAMTTEKAFSSEQRDATDWTALTEAGVVAENFHQAEEFSPPSPDQDPCLHCHIDGSEPGVWTPIYRWITFGSMGLIFLFGVTRNLSVWKTREQWHRRWMHHLGRILAVFFLVQIIAGIILLLFSKPMPEALLDTPVSFDFVIRAIHWGSGILLFITTLAFSFVGSQAPWDQRAFWATVFGIEFIGGIFAISELSLAYLRADWVILLSPSRLYTLHILLIPAVIASMIGVYFIVLRKQDIQ